MEYRSTNPGIHLSNNVAGGVGSSHGVEIGTHPTSTGAAIQSVGDDTSIRLAIFAKGLGGVAIGNSSNTVTLTGSALTLTSTVTTLGATNSQVQIGGSTAPFEGMLRLSTDLTTPNFTSTGADVQVTTCTVPGANSSHFLVVNPTNLSTAVIFSEAWMTATAAEAKLKFMKHNATVAVGTSTATFNILVFRFRS